MKKNEKPKEKESEVIAFRVSASLKAKLQDLAEQDKRKLGDFIRLVLVEKLIQTVEKGNK